MSALAPRQSLAVRISWQRRNIFYTASKQSFASWPHYRLLLAIDDLEARQWYESEAIRCAWSVRTLQRNIEIQYYYRIIASQIKEPVEEEMKAKTAEFQMERLEHVKSPMVLEFLGIPSDSSILESDLESAIISNLQQMLMELGNGYAFVGRQYRIHTEAKNYFIDLPTLHITDLDCNPQQRHPDW